MAWGDYSAEEIADAYGVSEKEKKAVKDKKKSTTVDDPDGDGVVVGEPVSDTSNDIPEQKVNDTKEYGSDVMSGGKDDDDPFTYAPEGPSQQEKKDVYSSGGTGKKPSGGKGNSGQTIVEKAQKHLDKQTAFSVERNDFNVYPGEGNSVDIELTQSGRDEYRQIRQPDAGRFGGGYSVEDYESDPGAFGVPGADPGGQGSDIDAGRFEGGFSIDPQEKAKIEARQDLEQQLEKKTGRDLAPGEDFTVKRTDEGYQATVTTEGRQVQNPENPNDPNERRAFGDINFDPAFIPGYRDPEEVLEERVETADRNLDALTNAVTTPIAVGERAVTGETGVVTETSRSFTRGGVGLLNIGQGILSGLELAEFAGEGVQETLSGDGSEFAGKTGQATVSVAQGFAKRAQERPLQTGARLTGSLVGSAILMNKFPSTRAVIQPGEELASGALTRAFPSVARRFPGGKIDNEEIVIRGATRAAKGAAKRGGYTLNLARGEAELQTTPYQQELIDRFRPGAAGDVTAGEYLEGAGVEIERSEVTGAGAQSEPLGSDTETILDATSQLENPADRALRTLPERRMAALEATREDETDTPIQIDPRTDDLPLKDKIDEFGGIRAAFRDQEKQGPRINMEDVGGRVQEMMSDDRAQTSLSQLVPETGPEVEQREEFRDFSEVENEIERRTKAQRRQLEGDFEGERSPFEPTIENERGRFETEVGIETESETGRRSAEATLPISDTGSGLDLMARSDTRMDLLQEFDTKTDGEQILEFEQELEDEFETEFETESEFEGENEFETRFEFEFEREPGVLSGGKDTGEKNQDERFFGIDFNNPWASPGEALFGEDLFSRPESDDGDANLIDFSSDYGEDLGIDFEGV